MNESIEACPLHWPLGFKRTGANQRFFSQFKQTPDAAQKFLRKQISLLGGISLIVSTNIPVRKDGYLYNDMMKERLDDPGVAIYFILDGEHVSMCCDQYKTVWENVYALGKSVEALRAIDRYGTSEFIKRAFTGFKELPEESSGKPWWEVLGVSKDAMPTVIKAAYLEKIKKAHPDAGGSDAEFISVMEAYKQSSNG